MIHIADNITIDENEIDEQFVRSSGPGGQHVNKTSTAVQLRFDVKNSLSLPEPVKSRLKKLAGKRMTEEGVLVIDANEFRSQKMNREEARARLISLITQATVKPKPRKKTRPTLGSKEKRLTGKHKHSDAKKLRKKIKPDS